MGEIIVGITAILIGALFCFSGNVWMRILFPLIGFFSGFSAGAGMIAAITGDGFLGTVFGWVVGLCVGLLFAALAYFFYAFSVVLAFAGLGFALSSGLLALLSIDWNWLVILLGTVAGIAFGLFAIVANMPMAILVVATSFFGSAVVLYGLMLVFNTASLGDFSNGSAVSAIKDSFGLYVLWITAAIAGIITQANIMKLESQRMRELWQSSATYSEMFSTTSTSVKKK